MPLCLNISIKSFKNKLPLDQHTMKMVKVCSLVVICAVLLSDVRPTTGIMQSIPIVVKTFPLLISVAEFITTTVNSFSKKKSGQHKVHMKISPGEDFNVNFVSNI